jgi:hypothetical protein
MSVVPYLRELVTIFQPRCPGFDTRSLCGIYGGQSGTGTGFFRLHLFLLRILTPPTALQSLITLLSDAIAVLLQRHQRTS